MPALVGSKGGNNREADHFLTDLRKPDPNCRDCGFTPCDISIPGLLLRGCQTLNPERNKTGNRKIMKEAWAANHKTQTARWVRKPSLANGRATLVSAKDMTLTAGFRWGHDLNSSSCKMIRFVPDPRRSGPSLLDCVTERAARAAWLFKR